MAGHQRPSYNLRLGMITSHFQTYIIWLVVIPNIWPDCVWLQHHLLSFGTWWQSLGHDLFYRPMESFFATLNGASPSPLSRKSRNVRWTTSRCLSPPKMKSFAPILGVFIFWIKSPCWLDLSLSNQIRSNVIYSYNIIIWYMYTYST